MKAVPHYYYIDNFDDEYSNQVKCVDIDNLFNNEDLQVYCFL